MPHGVYPRTEKFWGKFCVLCGEKVVSSQSRGKYCKGCKEPRPCKCGCGKLVKEVGGLYYKAHAGKGIPRTEEVKQKIRVTRIERKIPSWNTGLHWSDEVKDKIGKSHEGKKQSEETIRKKIKATTGKRRTLEFREGRSGDKCHFWEGGISFFPYDSGFTQALREKVRNRDGRRCQFPDCGKLENGVKHAVHHIDYNKDNSVVTNLVSLCVSGCHAKTNTDRLFWAEYFNQRVVDLEYQYD